MTSIVDAILDERDWADRLEGIRFASAGALTWSRAPDEPEAAFIDRAREEAAAAGHRTISIRGWLRL